MKVIAKNKRATYDYELTERMTAGIVLAGHEVKSVRNGNVSLGGAFAVIKNDELWLINCHIGKYKYAQVKDYSPTATRKLLVHKSELAKLQSSKQNGQHIVPTVIGLQGRYIKLELGLGRSKKRHDKRHTIKRKDTERDAQRTFKQRQ